LLPPKVNILDIGAGSGYDLWPIFLIKSASDFAPLPQSHILTALEQQSLLQHHGILEQYIEPQTLTAVNTYCRFKTIDLLPMAVAVMKVELPKKFFDFIVNSHCIFADKDQRVKSHKIYQKILESLKENGYVLIVVQEEDWPIVET